MVSLEGIFYSHYSNRGNSGGKTMVVESGERDCAVNRARLTFCQKQENINKKLSTIPPCHIVIPNLLFTISKILIILT